MMSFSVITAKNTGLHLWIVLWAPATILSFHLTAGHKTSSSSSSSRRLRVVGLSRQSPVNSVKALKGCERWSARAQQLLQWSIVAEKHTWI